MSDQALNRGDVCSESDDCPLCQTAKESGGHIIFDRDESLSNSSTGREESER
jgi:hypothetical protein